MRQYKANEFYEQFLEHFYLDSEFNVLRKNDGYHCRFSKNDPAKFFERSDGYWHLQMPLVRTTVKRAHLVYSLAIGRIPPGMDVDHIDGDRANDIPSNLRLVSRALNNRNRRKRSDNTSGVTGIRWSDYHKHYVIRRTVNDRRLSTSRKTMEEAIEVLEHFKSLDSSYTERHGM